MAELADALDLGSSAVKGVQVQVLFPAPALRSLGSARDFDSGLLLVSYRDELTPAKRLKFKSCSWHQLVVRLHQHPAMAFGSQTDSATYSPAPLQRCAAGRGKHVRVNPSTPVPQQ